MDKDALRKIMEASGGTPEQIEKAMAEVEKLAADTPPADEGMERLTMEQFNELIVSTVQKALEPLTKVDRKHAMFPGGDEEDLANLSKLERMGKFMTAVFLKNGAEALAVSGRALTEGTDSAGGYLVPPEFQADVLRIAEEYGVIRKFGTVVPMGSDTKNLNSITASVTAYWVAEEAQITESQPTVGRPILTAKKLAGITPYSNELFADASAKVYDLLVALFAEAFAAEEDAQGLAGDGTTFTGILNASGVNSVQMASGNTSFADVDFDNILDMVDALTEGQRAGARFLYHRNISTYLRKLKDANSQYIWTAPTASEPETLYGYPVSRSDKLPGTSDDAVATEFLAFGNPRWTYLGDRQQVSITIGTEGTVGSNNLFEKDMAALRVIERVGIVVGIESAYAVLKTAAS